MSLNLKALAALGGLKDISEVIKLGNETLKGVKVRNLERGEIPVHCALAASFGTLNKESVKQLDHELKMMIAGTTREISRLKDRSWDNVLAAMMQSSMLKPVEGSTIRRSDKLIKDGTNYFKFSGSPDRTIVNEVYSWFVTLINDADVLKDTNIDIEMMAKIVAESGATVDNFATFFYKSSYYEKTVVDIGIIRFPDIDHPYFKLYRIELKAWKDCSRILFAQDDKNGITGLYNCIHFEPRPSIMVQLKVATKEKAIKEAESLFD